jgi:peptide alpha-N-acetyltransferase
MLAVSSSFRNQGIATTLVRRAIDVMVERDADEVVLETEVTNTGAMKLYERLGFLRSKKLHRYYLNGNTAYRLVLQLKSGLGKELLQGEATEEQEERLEQASGGRPLLDDPPSA